MAEARSAETSASGALREPGVLQRVVCAVFAWSVTVAPAVFSRSGSWPSRALAILALVAGALGPTLVPSRRRVGRHVGISAFLGLTTLAWILSPQAMDVARIDFILAIVGAVSWAVYALSWGEPWRLREATESEDPSGSLRARAELPPFAVPIAALGVIGAVVLMVVAWRVREPARALAAQVAAIGLGVALVSSAATLAVSRGRPRHASASVPKPAVRAMLVLVMAAILGGVLLLLRASG